MTELASIITQAYAVVWRERLTCLRLAGPAVLGLSLVSALVFRLDIGHELLLSLVATQFAVAWHRHQLLPDEPVSLRGTYQWGRPFGRYLLWVMGISLMTAPIVIGSQIFSFYAAAALVGTHSPWTTSVSWLLSLPLLVPALLIFARLSPALPATAIDRPLSYRQAWQLTRGMGWQVWVLILFVAGPASLFSMVCMMLASGVDGALTGLLILLGCGLFFLSVALLSTALSLLYRQLMADGGLEGHAQASEAARADAPPEPPRTGLGLGRWFLNGAVSGLVLGGLAFVIGFFVYPLVRPSNLAPLMGFILAPFGFLVGMLIGLAWHARALRLPGPLGWGIAAAIVALTAVLTMSSWFIPGLMVRSLLLDLEVLPAMLKKPLAPAGTLAVWAIDIPPGEQAAYRERLRAYLGGPLLGMRGHHELSFHTSPTVGHALREARAGQRLPDVLVSHQWASIDAVFSEPGMGAAWQSVGGQGPLARIGPLVFIHRQGAHRALTRALALQDLACGNRVLSEQTSPALRQALAGRAVALANAIVQGRPVLPAGGVALMSLEHASLAMQAPVHVVSSRFCGAWGSSTLALAEVVVQVDAAQTIGPRRLLLALRQEGEAWTLLSVSALDETRDAVVAQAVRLEQALMSRHGHRALTELAQPAEPHDWVPSRQAKQRSGYLIWYPSPAPGVVAEVAEVACRARDLRGADHDDVQWSIHVRDPAQDNRYYLHGSRLCSRGWPWKWRLWTVTAGELGASEEQLIPTVDD